MHQHCPWQTFKRLCVGEISIVGPALSALDANLAFQDNQSATNVKDARKNASHFAAAQEARNMLSEPPRTNYVSLGKPSCFFSAILY